MAQGIGRESCGRPHHQSLQRLALKGEMNNQDQTQIQIGQWMPRGQG